MAKPFKTLLDQMPKESRRRIREKGDALKKEMDERERQQVRRDDRKRRKPKE